MRKDFSFLVQLHFPLFQLLYPSSCLFVSDKSDSILSVTPFRVWKALIRNLSWILFFWPKNPGNELQHVTILAVSPGLAPVYCDSCTCGRVLGWTKDSK